MLRSEPLSLGVIIIIGGRVTTVCNSPSGSCADIMHSAHPFRNGFKESVIAIILRDVVQGLEYLHNLGYVHRCVEMCS